jgi:hypothetical protein
MKCIIHGLSARPLNSGVRRREATVIQQIRITRPVVDVERSVAMYTRGLGWRKVGGFIDHNGFDGAMLQGESKGFHVEFTSCRNHPVRPSPTREDLLVVYVPDSKEWGVLCASMLEAAFVEVKPFNPYWAQYGRTFQDPDGYLVVIQQSSWKG